MPSLYGKPKRPKPQPLPPCADRDRELLASDVARLGLDIRKRWYACSTGEHPAHCRCKPG